MTNAPPQTEALDKFGWNEGDPEIVKQGNGNASPLPKYDELFKPTLEALAKLGRSGSIEELDEAVTAAIGASQEQLDVTYPKSGAAVLPDRMKWAQPSEDCAADCEPEARRVGADRRGPDRG
jgi:hypothetical protein